jgi:DNA-binding CsgD family transcriptional regulator
VSSPYVQTDVAHATLAPDAGCTAEEAKVGYDYEVRKFTIEFSLAFRLRGVPMDRRTPPLIGTDPLRGLTRRQQQIVQLLKTGPSNKEIARVLGISDGTVKIHLHAIYEKLEVTSRNKLVALLV